MHEVTANKEEDLQTDDLHLPLDASTQTRGQSHDEASEIQLTAPAWLVWTPRPYLPSACSTPPRPPDRQQIEFVNIEYLIQLVPHEITEGLQLQTFEFH